MFSLLIYIFIVVGDVFFAKQSFPTLSKFKQYAIAFVLSIIPLVGFLCAIWGYIEKFTDTDK